MFRAVLDQAMLTWNLFRDSRVPAWQKAIPLVALAYVLSPFDLIPDFALGIGQLDDIGIILGSMRLFESVAPENVVREYRRRLSQRPR